MGWKHLLAYITGTVDQELLLRNEYLWHRKLVAQKFDGYQQCKAPGRPKIAIDLEALVVRAAAFFDEIGRSLHAH